MKSEKKIFFNGLNELRAFAALAVIFHHIELFKERDHVSSLISIRYFHYFLEKLGKNGVYLFFVLSGFLITFLLLKEKEKNGKILFGKFYLRRIFRIWPLYYLILIISLVAIPLLGNSFEIFKEIPYYFTMVSNAKNYSIETISLYLFFLPNLALSMGKIMVGITQAWSVGVEEQFYILWPLLILVFSRKRIAIVFSLILISFMLVKFFNVSYIVTLLEIVPFEYMAIGALGGYLYFYHKEKVTLYSKSKLIYLFVLASILFLLFIRITSNYFQSIILGFLFLVLILISVDDENSIVFRNKYFSFLGTISYGIYMYHPFVLFLVFPFANGYLRSNEIYYNIYVYALVLSLTILFSHLSYKYVESFFIKIKDSKYKSL